MSSPRSKRDDQNQLPLALFTPMKVEARGDGTFLVTQGKPTAFLTPEQFADRVGISRSSIYRLRGSECLPERFFEYAGERKIKIMAEAVQHYLDYWKGVRGDGSELPFQK